MRSLTGYAAVFWDGSPASEYRLSEDATERVMPSAFDSSLASPDDVVAAWNHNMDFLLGSRAAGTLKLTKDKKGLRYEIGYDESDPHHVSVMAKVKRGDVPGSSFSFAIRDEKVRRENGGFIRELHDVKLFECGPVWRPAYKGTTASARSGAKYGSCRWAVETSPEVVREYEKRQQRIRQIERQQVMDRLWQLERTR